MLPTLQDWDTFFLSDVLTSIYSGHHNPKPNTSASSQETFWQQILHLQY
ncbi:MAG: hypothetical protein V7K97_20895 [Nostoc sp.]